jgi:hypothetical protein
MARDVKRSRRWRERYLAHRRAVTQMKKVGAPMSFEEIGRRMDITPQYAGKLYRSGMAKLRRRMGIQ